MTTVITGNPLLQGLAAGTQAAGGYADWMMEKEDHDLRTKAARLRIAEAERQMQAEEEARAGLQQMGEEIFSGMAEPEGSGTVAEMEPGVQGPPALGSPLSSDDHAQLESLGAQHADFLKRSGKLWAKLKAAGDHDGARRLEQDVQMRLQREEQGVRRKAVERRLQQVVQAGGLGPPEDPSVQMTAQSLMQRVKNPREDPDDVWADVQKAVEPIRKQAIQQARAQQMAAEAAGTVAPGVQLGAFGQGLLQDLAMGMDPDEFQKQWKYARLGLEPDPEDGEFRLPEDIAGRKRQREEDRRAKQEAQAFEQEQKRSQGDQQKIKDLVDLVKALKPQGAEAISPQQQKLLDSVLGELSAKMGVREPDSESPQGPPAPRPTTNGTRHWTSLSDFEKESAIAKLEWMVESGASEDELNAFAAKADIDSESLPLEVKNKLKDAATRREGKRSLKKSEQERYDNQDQRNRDFDQGPTPAEERRRERARANKESRQERMRDGA